MNHNDMEVSEIVVVVDENGSTLEVLVKLLQENGVAVTDTDADNGVVEGTVEAAKVKSIEKLPGVKYVRNVFTYVADFPVGDPRNQDCDDCEDEEIPR
jgi:hypothetical protein